jgi:hypothetical protein
MLIVTFSDQMVKDHSLNPSTTPEHTATDFTHRQAQSCLLDPAYCCFVCSRPHC